MTGTSARFADIKRKMASVSSGVKTQMNMLLFTHVPIFQTLKGRTKNEKGMKKWWFDGDIIERT